MNKQSLKSLIISILVVAAVALASNLTIPNSFTPGTPTSASQMNGNFAAVAAAVNDNNTRISTLEATAFVPPTCGAGQYLSCNGTTCSCPTIGALAPLSTLGVGTSAPPTYPRLYVEGLDRWNPWAAQVYGDFYVGSASYGIKMGVALGGGGAGAATLAAQGGINNLNIGAGTTQAQQQAISITSGVVTITQVAWSGLTFLTSGGVATGFGNYGAGYQSCAVFKDSSGIVHLRGLALNTSGVSKTIVTTLPVGSRPAAIKIFNQYASTGPVRVDIGTNGEVFLSVAMTNYGWVSLEGITFDTRS